MVGYGKTFVTDSSPTVRHRKPHKNAAIFRLLVNKMSFRRIWLRQDYIEAIQSTKSKNLAGDSGPLKATIAATYEDIAKRDDVEMLDNINDDLALPKNGMQVHGEYTV